MYNAQYYQLFDIILNSWTCPSGREIKTYNTNSNKTEQLQRLRFILVPNDLG
jgi:hypothetical protein